MSQWGEKNLRYNYVVNLLDGGFFGFAFGFASFSTVIPLFVASLTDSAALIGLIPALHVMGWQLPQLFTARHISTLSHYKPFTMLATIHERVPLLGLALIALALPHMQNWLALVLTFLMLAWQGLGAGFAANAWQNMIGKVIPSEYLATFFGFQSSAANLLGGLGAVVAGFLLDRSTGSTGFAWCFFLASISAAISFFFLNLTREPARTPSPTEIHYHPLWRSTLRVLKTDTNFRNFLRVRILSQFGAMAFAFYTVYAVEYHGMSPATAGIMTSVLFITQVVANPILGHLADRWSRKWVLEIGSFAIVVSALLAWLAPNLSWFALVYAMTGIANTTLWTISMAFILEFGEEGERPTYVGMANTLVAPAAILAPLLGGWLADSAGYPATFIVAAVAGLATTILLRSTVKEISKK